MTEYSCPLCNSIDVYWDAWISANDHRDYMTFSNAWCRDCDGRSSYLNERLIDNG